jgi:hypothetical protein
MLAIAGLYRRLLEALAVVAGVLLAAMTLAIVFDVVVRNLGWQPPGHTLTLTEYGLLYVTVVRVTMIRLQHDEYFRDAGQSRGSRSYAACCVFGLAWPSPHRSLIMWRSQRLIRHRTLVMHLEKKLNRTPPVRGDLEHRPAAGAVLRAMWRRSISAMVEAKSGGSVPKVYERHRSARSAPKPPANERTDCPRSGAGAI